MTVVQTVASLDPDAGGPSRTVSATAQALAGHGLNIELVTTTTGGRDRALVPVSDAVHVAFVPEGAWWTQPYRFYRQTRERTRASAATIVHDHGVWLPVNWASFQAAKQAGMPYVLSTRGMLEPWALNHHAWRKNVAWIAYQHRILQQTALFHATALAEAHQLRALGLTAPIVVAPNGVAVPNEWKQSPTEGHKRRALFLSRIHPKKGLLNLMEAWARIQPSDWELVIAGPDEGGHQADVVEKARACGIDANVSFLGAIPDEEKWTLYRSSDLFVLPTFSENFGVVVAEALASGIPVITTTGAPWEVLETADCGWWVDIGVDPLVDALREAMAVSDAERVAMGQRGRALVQERFTWKAIAETLHAAYLWLHHPQAPRPEAEIPENQPVRCT